ncbi:NAD-dependent epimerase/dehydratase family protein [Tabrizicola sp. M-4]|uniref:NAD-dependent epimerase/dehydratase family protein n=1 Tax=Tabrizicola sp. M-4 TaxID=3055847 RepID=UPI003DA9BB8F
MIRWIVEGKLGTGPAEQSTPADAIRIDVRHLLDAPGNDPASIEALIRQGVAALHERRTVLVLCDFGVSRSNAIAAGILARYRSIPFTAAIRQVIERTGETEIKVSMIETVRRVLGGEETLPKRGGRIAVTGGTGMLGSAVIQRLGDRAAAFLGRSDFDLKDSPALLAARLREEDASTVIHLAHPRIFSNNNALAEALHMQKNVMDAAVAAGATFVLVSCSAVFGKLPMPCKVRPDAERRPSEIVGIIKLLQEELALHGSTSRGPETKIVRLPALYGAGCARPKFIRNFRDAIIAGRPVRTHRFPLGAAQLELLHVADAATGIVAVAERGTARNYHLGSSNPIATARIAEMSSQALQRPFIHEEIIIEEAGFVPSLDWAETRRELGWFPSRDFAEELPAILQAYPAYEA